MVTTAHPTNLVRSCGMSSPAHDSFCALLRFGYRVGIIGPHSTGKTPIQLALTNSYYQRLHQQTIIIINIHSVSSCKPIDNQEYLSAFLIHNNSTHQCLDTAHDTVQSYEQGWRPDPPPTIMALGGHPDHHLVKRDHDSSLNSQFRSGQLAARGTYRLVQKSPTPVTIHIHMQPRKSKPRPTPFPSSSPSSSPSPSTSFFFSPGTDVPPFATSFSVPKNAQVHCGLSCAAADGLGASAPETE